ncbi:equilibrative nucleoside transporter 2 isoform X3 [Gopherus flavomarginatus]|uniref:equilibrative nucleoside transporter 2 isoform X3 n=1 Tax=Gopherus flavomarginatus TaxID=286002 RepID=UPI0021CC07FC|nr:equilibrative nucleoside transporter 2 isoform X3 [Gopherus flavomarginatus]
MNALLGCSRRRPAAAAAWRPGRASRCCREPGRAVHCLLPPHKARKHPLPSTQMARQDTPKDQFHAVGIIFFILGLGTLLPWNFFITAIPYFQARLIVGTSSTVGLEGNSSGTQQDPARDEFNFNNWLTLLSQLPLLLFTLLNSFLYQCIPDKVRVLGSMSGILLLFILTAGLVRVEMPPHSFFSITISSVWFINSFCAVLQGSLFGQLGILPQGYSTLFLSGQGMAGTFATSAMLLSMASGADAQTSALSYFITPCVGTLTSIVCYLVLPRMAFFRHYLERSWQRDPHNELETKAGLLGPEEQSGDQSERPGEEPQGPEKPMLGMANGTLRTLEEISVESSGKGAFALHNGTATSAQNRGPGPERPSVFNVLRKIWLLALCIVMVFTVTLSVFPAITATVTSTSESKQWSEFFTPVCCFLLFNMMDWLGRSITLYCLWASAATGERAGWSHHDLFLGTRAVVWGCALLPPQGPAVSSPQIHPFIFSSSSECTPSNWRAYNGRDGEALHRRGAGTS